MAHQRAREADQDSTSYTLPHDIPLMVAALADQERIELDLPRLSPSAYMTRLIRRIAAEKLDEEKLTEIKTQAEAKTQRRREEGADEPGSKRKSPSKAK